MQVLLYKKTKDSDLKQGLQICYPDVLGNYTKIGTIAAIKTIDGVLNYIIEGQPTKDDINTAMGAYMAEELKLIAPLKLNSVKVLFEDSIYNYPTNVSSQTTEIKAMQYFVGKCFNMGVFPVENMQQCIGIEFTNNNL